MNLSRLTDSELLIKETELRLKIKTQEKELTLIANTQNSKAVIEKMREYGLDDSRGLAEIFIEKRERELG